MSLLIDKVDARLKLNSDQLSLLSEFKHWVEEEAEFYGRSDQDFLVLFLRSCDFEMELSKTTLRMYYRARLKYPQWWTNRDLHQPQLQFLFKNRFAYALTDQSDGNYPAVMVINVSCMGPDPSIWDYAGKYFSCGMDGVARRANCQLNGGVIIFDLSNYYMWIIWKSLWPPFMRNLVNSFLLSVPMRINMVIYTNAPAYASAFVSLVRSFLPQVQCCRNVSDLSRFVPLEILPTEWGGNAGPIKDHEDDAINEMLGMNEYFLDDDKYGFSTN